jgi:hypothetical protein
MGQPVMMGGQVGGVPQGQAVMMPGQFWNPKQVQNNFQQMN